MSTTTTAKKTSTAAKKPAAKKAPAKATAKATSPRKSVAKKAPAKATAKAKATTAAKKPTAKKTSVSALSKKDQAQNMIVSAMAEAKTKDPQKLDRQTMLSQLQTIKLPGDKEATHPAYASRMFHDYKKGLKEAKANKDTKAVRAMSTKIESAA